MVCVVVKGDGCDYVVKGVGMECGRMRVEG